MIDAWLFAVGAVIVGLLSGIVGATLARAAILKGREQRPEMHDAARASAIFVFLFFVAIGVITVIGVTSLETLRPLPAQALAYSPHVLAAGLILIVARALGHGVHGYVMRAFSRTSAVLRGKLAQWVRFVVTAAGVVLAIRQLGIDTTILNVLIGAVAFGLALAFALLVGLGGRDLGRLAMGRYLQRIVSVGDHLDVVGQSGLVVALHPATVEVELADGSSVHLANSQVFTQLPRTRRWTQQTPIA